VAGAGGSARQPVGRLASPPVLLWTARACVFFPPSLRPRWTRFAVSAPGGGASTSQGHPRTIFRRALEHGNLLVAEATAREIGHVSLAEALELTALIAEKEPSRHGRFAVRWLMRYLQERGSNHRRDFACRRQPCRASRSTTEGGLVIAAGLGLKEKSRAIPQAPLAARKAKRRLAVSQEPLGSRTSLHAEQRPESGEPGLAADACGKLTARQAHGRREACPGSMTLSAAAADFPPRPKRPLGSAPLRA
jgi:hypothetical protein